MLIKSVFNVGCIQMGSSCIRLLGSALMSVVASNIHCGALLPVCSCDVLNAAELSFVLLFLISSLKSA